MPQSLKKKGEIIAVKPSRHVDISRTEKNPDRLEEMYQLGRLDAESRLGDIIRFIEK